MSTSALIVLTKNPVAGKVKTRIAATLGDAAALEIHKRLVNHTIGMLSQLRLNTQVYYSDHIELNDPWDKLDASKYAQRGETLGDRMSNAFGDVLGGCDKAVCIGTDCPYLTSDHILSAFRSLDVAEVVIGPAVDGGYYLIGMRAFFPWLFTDIIWGGRTVFATTLERWLQTDLTLKLLPTLADIDTAQDWDEFSRLESY